MTDMQVFLETERLTLRRFIEGDVDDLFALHNDPDVMRFINGGKPTLRETIERNTLPRWLTYHERGDEYGFWAAIEKSTGAFLGWFHFYPPDAGEPHDAELGYRLHKAAWGKGYGTEGARALIRRGFAEGGVQRVFAGTYQDNLGSRRVMEKAGLTLVRTYRPTLEELTEVLGDDGAPDDLWDGDDVEYELTREDWERQRQEAERSSVVGR